jgi:hypothetical protein
MHARRRLLAAAVLALALCAACRKSSSSFSTTVITASTEGASGCSGAALSFTNPLTALTAGLTLGPSSQICAARGGEILYATGAAARVYQIVADPAMGSATSTLIVDPGEVAAFLTLFGISTAPELSGVCVLDQDSLIVMEHTSNTLLLIDRGGSGVLGVYAGSPNTTPGFADGFPGRFDFTTPSQVVASGGTPPEVIVADTGNDRVRIVTQGQVQTLAGSGITSSVDGDLESAGFDGPVGLSITCNSRILVAERAGNHLRDIVLTATGFGLDGLVMTLAGGGAQPSGPGTDVELVAPSAPYITADGETYWIDAGHTGSPAVPAKIRRQRVDGTVDCPLWTNCTTTPGGWPLTTGGTFSLTMTDSGTLYVLNAGNGTIYFVRP